MPFKGYKQTAEHIKICRDKKIGKKKQPLSIETRKKIADAHRGMKYRPHTKEQCRKMGERQRGERNHQWRGGITPINDAIRSSSQYNEWRKSIFERDNYTCRCCGIRGGYLEVHHSKKPLSTIIQEAIYCFPLLSKFDAVINYSPTWDLDNGKTLCKKCHYTPENHRGIKRKIIC